MEEKEWIGRSRKNIASFFSLVLKTPVSENMDPKELKNFLEQKSRSLLSSPSEDSRINSMIRFIEEHYREDISAADLSERFGLRLSYLALDKKRYQDMVLSLCHRMNLTIPDSQILVEANRWEIQHGSRTPRVAVQLVEKLAGETADC